MGASVSDGGGGAGAGGAFMANPEGVLREYMAAREGVGSDGKWYEVGKLAMAMRMITVVRTLEMWPVVGDWEGAAVVSAFYTLLKEAGMEDAWDSYEALADWRGLRFEAIAPEGSSSNGWPVRELSTIVGADVPEQLDLLGESESS